MLDPVYQVSNAVWAAEWGGQRWAESCWPVQNLVRSHLVTAAPPAPTLPLFLILHRGFTTGFYTQQWARCTAAAWQPFDPSVPKRARAHLRMRGCLYRSPHVIPGGEEDGNCTGHLLSACRRGIILVLLIGMLEIGSTEDGKVTSKIRDKSLNQNLYY